MRMYILLLLLFLNGCINLNKLQVNGEITGTRYSNEQFTKGKHLITTRYPINNFLNIKGSISQQYKTTPLLDVERPDYGETSLEIIF